MFRWSMICHLSDSLRVRLKKHIGMTSHRFWYTDSPVPLVKVQVRQGKYPITVLFFVYDLYPGAREEYIPFPFQSHRLPFVVSFTLQYNEA